MEKDVKQAFAWFLKSAQQEYAPAQYNVGMCYKNGEGVEKNLSEAIKWFKKASEQGHDRSKNILGDYSDTTKKTEQSNPKSLHADDINDIVQKSFNESIEGQQELFQDKIDKQIAEFQNEKATIIEKTKQDIEKNNAVLLETAKKELEKQAWWFSTILLVVMLAFIGIMFSYLTCSLEGIKETLQAQFDSPKLTIERIDALQKEVELLKTNLKAVEQKSNNQLPSKQ